jgi:hypothetical protein
MSEFGPSATWQGIRTKAAVSPTADILAPQLVEVVPAPPTRLGVPVSVIVPALPGKRCIDGNFVFANFGQIEGVANAGNVTRYQEGKVSN